MSVDAYITLGDDIMPEGEIANSSSDTYKT